MAAGPTYGEMAAGVPVRLKIKALRLDAAVVPVRVSTDAVLDPPSDYREVGWWTGSAEPGAGSGQTVLTGHTVHTISAAPAFVILFVARAVDLVDADAGPRPERSPSTTIRGRPASAE